MNPYKLITIRRFCTSFHHNNAYGLKSPAIKNNVEITAARRKKTSACFTLKINTNQSQLCAGELLNIIFAPFP